MIRDYNVISKGKYEYKQTNEFLHINRFLIVRKKKRRMLLLDMENISNETLTAVKLQIEQFDVRGKDLGPVTFDMKTSYKQGAFILKKAIALHHSCIDFRVKVVAAEYGNYVYRLGSEDTYITYEKKKKRKKLQDSAIRKKTGKTGHLEGKRRFKAPVFVGIVAGAIILTSAFATFAHLQGYKEDKSQFFIQNLKYEFIDGNKEEGSPVFITGYIGLGGEDVTIPNNVEGHPVQGIAQGAFANNSIIETLTVEKGVAISVDAFYNCDSLQSITLLGENIIEEYAFAECDELTTIKATDLLYAGNMAFSNAQNLKSFRIETSAGNTGTVHFGEKVVTGAQEMQEIYIDRYISYGDQVHYFDAIGSVEKLYLKNMNYAAYSENGALDTTLADVFGDNGVDVKKFEIQYADVIPAFLMEGSGQEITEFTVRNITETTVGEAAFKDCTNLATINIPKLLTEVGASAFEGTAITSFNALALKKMGVAAFRNCAELTDFQLDVISELESISKEAFSGCESLPIMYVPAKVEKIGDKAFYDCKALETFTFAMDGGLLEIGDNAFELCKKLTTLSLPAKLEKIGSGAFKTCNRLNYISIPQSVEKIEADAFEECYRLYEIENLSYDVEITAGIGLGEYALIVYNSASDIRMQRKTAGDYVLGEVNDTWYLLWYLGSESELTFPQVEGISSYVVQSYLFIDTEGVTAINIPDQATKIGKMVFHESDVSRVNFTGSNLPLTFTAETFGGCESLVEVHFNNRTFDKIEAGLFAGCTNLAVIGLPKYLTAIEDNAFAGCQSLTTISGGQSVRSIGDNAFSNCYNLSNFAFSESLLTIGNYAFFGCESLTACTGATALEEIGMNAFADCSALTTVTLPETLKSIGQSAFSGCGKLKSITIPSLITSLESSTFYGCSSLASISGCRSLTTIGERAFYQCSSLTKVAMSVLATVGMESFYGCSSLTSVSMPILSSMGTYSFYGCSSLGSVNFSSNLSKIPDYAFADSGIMGIEGGNCLTAIGTRAFYNCDRLTSVSIPISVKTLGVESFRDCDALRQLTLNSGLSSIGSFAFENCDGLTSVTTNVGLSTIGSYAFANCRSISSVTLNDGISSVDSYAFSGCTELQRVTVGNNVNTLSTGVFTDCSKLTTLKAGNGLGTIANLAFAGCNALQKVTIESVSTIGNSAFADCSKLSTVSIGNVSTIGNSAFSNCTSLNVLELGENISKIDAYAFSNCTNLGSIILPESLTSLGSYAFQNCTGLEVARISNGVSYIYSGTFSGCTSLSKVYLGANLISIGTDAFAGCDKLYEVYNFSKYLSLTLNSENNGYVAYNAIIIHTAENESLTTVNVGKFVFKTSGSTWALVNYTGSESSLTLDSMSYSGGTITQYEIARYAFKSCSSLQTLKIGSAVTSIRSNAFSGLRNLQSVDFSDVNYSLTIPTNAFVDTYSLEYLVIPKHLVGLGQYAFSNYGDNFRVYFEGEIGTWNYYQYYISESVVYFYDTCIHYEKEWNYKNGKINTQQKEFKVSTKPATCLDWGEDRYYCDTCSDGYISEIYPLGHTYANSECTRCGYINNLFVQSSSLAHFREVVTIKNNSKNAFDLFEYDSNKIYAPDVYSTESQLTFTAKKGIRLEFSAYAKGDCVLTIEWSGQAYYFENDSRYLTIDLMAGQSVTFTYLDKRVIEVEPEPDDSSSEDMDSSSEWIDSSESSADSSESTNDWESNYSTRETEQYAIAYISSIYVSSLDERNPG